MPLYANNLLDEITSRPIEGAHVYVYTLDGATEASIQDELGAAVTQPLVTGADGDYAFQAPTGLYQLVFWKNARRIYRDRAVQVGTGPVLPADVLTALGGVDGASYVGTTDGDTVEGDLKSRPAFPSLQDYDNQGDTTASTQIARYLAQDAGSGLPLLLNGPIVIGETIDMVRGAKLIAPGGPLNVATKFLATPSAPGLLPLSLEPGFTGNAINVPADAYDAYLEGLWLDLRNQVSGDGVSFNDSTIAGGTATQILRSGAVMRRCKVYNAAGRGIYNASFHHEVNLFNVLVQDTRGLAATYFEGGDLTMDQLWAQNSAQYGHYFKNAAECRIGHLESWQALKNNVRVEGFSRNLIINRLISDDAGEHGVIFTQAASDTHMPDQVRIMNIRSSDSGQSASNTFDDIHFDDQDGTYSGMSRIHISGMVGGNSGQPTRHNIGATIAASTNYRALCRWRVSDFSFAEFSTFAGTRASVMNAAARQVVRIGGGVHYGTSANPEPLPQTPLTGGANLVDNGDFSAWSGTVSQPDGWLASSAGVLTLDAVNTFEGRSSLKITAGATLNGGAIFHVPNPLRYRGKRMTLALRVINSEAEATTFNTRVRINAGSVTIPDYLVGVAAGIQYAPISFDVGSDATIISILVTPCGSATNSGRSVSIQDVVLVEGNQIPDVVPRNPSDTLGWYPVTLTPSGGNAALDARVGGTRYRITMASAGNFVGIVNAKPMQEILLHFVDSNATLVTFSTLKRADGTTAPRPIAAGTIVRAVWDGNNWICDLPGAFVPQSSTIAQLPTSGALEGGIWFCTDLGGGAGLIEYRSGKYRRYTSGTPLTYASDANRTIAWLTDSSTVLLTGIITADRTITLDATRAADGSTFRFVRTGAGAFNWSIGGLKNLAVNQWCEVMWTGAAWTLTAFGAL